MEKSSSCGCARKSRSSSSSSSSSSQSRRKRRGKQQRVKEAQKLLEKQTNNNNNAIWRGPVLTGEELPPHSGELNRTESQLSRRMSTGHHISVEHRLQRKHRKSKLDSNARNETYVKEIQEKGKQILRKKTKNGKQEKNEK